MSRKTYKKEIMGETWWMTDYPPWVRRPAGQARTVRLAGENLSKCEHFVKPVDIAEWRCIIC